MIAKSLIPYIPIPTWSSCVLMKQNDDHKNIHTGIINLNVNSMW